jgi:hypothetical protein
MNNDLSALTSVLQYHILSGKLLAESLVGKKFETLNGAELTVTVNLEEVKVNNVRVTGTNIVTDNGVIHVIDTLLTLPLPLPERNTPFPSATAFNDKSEKPTITVTITVIIFYFIKLKSSRRK